MALNRFAIARFIEHFQAQAVAIETVNSSMLRKLLYATALDPLARAAFGDIGHRRAIVRLLDDLTTWDGKGLVSLPQLSFRLAEAKRGRYRLAREVRRRLSGWPPGHVLHVSRSPSHSDLLKFSTPAEAKLIDECRYPNLFYTYRNNLVHEFREPGYGAEFSTDKGKPYYMSTIDGPWELVFPVGFFRFLFTEALEGLATHLSDQRIDPYMQFKFGSMWRAR